MTAIKTDTPLVHVGGDRTVIKHLWRYRARSQPILCRLFQVRFVPSVRPCAPPPLPATVVCPMDQ